MAEVKTKASQISQIHKNITTELETIDKDLDEIDNLRRESVEKIEIKKIELREFSNSQSVCEEHYETLKEIALTGKAIEAKQISITLLDTTIMNLDLEIAKIQAHHDKAVGELEMKRRKLNEYLQYYDDLNEKVEKLLIILGEEESKHCMEINRLRRERSDLLRRTDLCEADLNKLLEKLDGEVDELNKEHLKLIEVISNKLSAMEIGTLGETTDALKEKAEQEEKPGQEEKTEKEKEPGIQTDAGQEAEDETAGEEVEIEQAESAEVEGQEEMFEDIESTDIDEDQLVESVTHEKDKVALPHLSTSERYDLLRQGVQITPSNRIITADDKVLTLKEAQQLGLIGISSHDANEAEFEIGFIDYSPKEEHEEEVMKDVSSYGISLPSQKEEFQEYTISFSTSSFERESSDILMYKTDSEYLKLVFGKSLSLALAEITAVQPRDPIHYLAHWMLRYRYNQEIDEVRRVEIQELMIEQERLAAEKWHCELQEEARLAVLEALFRAENIIIYNDFQSHLMEQYGEDDATDIDSNLSERIF